MIVQSTVAVEDLYRNAEVAVLRDPEGQRAFQWQETVQRPENGNRMAFEIIFVICNSGMHHKAGRAIFDRIMDALMSNKSAHDVFGHQGKASAIDVIWSNRNDYYNETILFTDDELLTWAATLPWVGPITKYHVAKNLGADVAKPDRWIQRLADIYEADPHQMCAELAVSFRRRVATIDLVLWWALSRNYVLLPTAQVSSNGELFGGYQ